MILVTIPYWKSAITLLDSVKSILKQSYTDYEVVIINDGDSPTPKELIKLKHPKLKYFDLKENRGRYFADAVALEASPYEFFLPHDADDISSFHRLFYLNQKQVKTHADTVFHYQRLKLPSGKLIRETYPLMQQPLQPTMRHIAHWSALYKTQSLKNIGGIHPDFRVGYDTLLVNLIRLTCSVAMTPRFLYDRTIRPDSLTTSVATGFNSPHRRAAIGQLIMLYNKCYKSPDNIKKIITSSIQPSTMLAVKKEAKRMRSELWGL